MFDTPTPELQTMPLGLYDLVTYAIVAAGFALFAYFLYSWNSTGEVGVRYRPAVLAGLCIAGVAALSYLVLYTKWDTGFDLVGGVYEPNAEARSTLYPRYVDWSVTVPLLTAELLAVCSIAGARARGLRLRTMTAAFLMILTGFLGSQVLAQGRDVTALVVWGLISTAFYAYLYVALIGAVRASMSSMGVEAGRSLRNAALVLLGTFGVYPLVYAVPVFVDVTPAWLAGMQVAYSAADVLAKVGFGVLVHKVAKLRTAEDVAAGVDTHPESVWVSSVRHSEAVLPDPRSEHRTTRFAGNTVDDAPVSAAADARHGATRTTTGRS
ncbi:bacteriorhodopsin [Geodermatophilus nigrescens]|uniref:Bacteriorhodopsin n=1 Tax=Geodermatophilus nigrescens TaxID=1070870 RepID=A0A1M5IPU0_9ACTN|nr:bacteriorhodopsin [Geodermatophilus nigrescens]SHG30246.1 Bacteriorhodopsin [Geodermatophilus nigrescens]